MTAKTRSLSFPSHLPNSLSQFCGEFITSSNGTYIVHVYQHLHVYRFIDPHPCIYTCSCICMYHKEVLGLCHNVYMYIVCTCTCTFTKLPGVITIILFATCFLPYGPCFSNVLQVHVHMYMYNCTCIYTYHVQYLMRMGYTCSGTCTHQSKVIHCNVLPRPISSLENIRFFSLN